MIKNFSSPPGKMTHHGASAKYQPHRREFVSLGEGGGGSRDASFNIAVWGVLFLIRLYQKTFSPDHGFFSSLFFPGVCRFYPSCSQYVYQAISSRGFWRGLYLGLKRIVKCHPFHSGGYDPLIIKK